MVAMTPPKKSRRRPAEPPAEQPADKAIEHPAGRTIRYCRLHGACDLARASKGGSGKWRCPVPGCRRFLGLVPPEVEPGKNLPPGYDLWLVNEPEIIALRKDLETARLRKEIRELAGPLELDEALGALADVWKRVEKLEEEALRLKRALDNSPTESLREQFKCSCGSSGFVSVKIRCGACQRETWWGWQPPKTGDT